MFGKRVRTFYRNLVLDTMKMRDENNIVRQDMIHLLMQIQKGSLKSDGIKDNNNTEYSAAVGPDFSPNGKCSKNR